MTLPSKKIDLAVREALPIRLGRNIASRRKALGLTQADLAERLGVDTETLSRFERGKHAPSLMTLERLAAELLATCAELLDEAPAAVTSEAHEMEALIGGLTQSDVAFIRRSLKALRDHLASRAKGS
ncbi:helix-turn-helix domain-containing protein [Roseateles sp. UC29_93]|uniref:helix-turn-helix domain-containing protein n=1 Tax=Roseateles sp. UC29_93 TaxID=3350177 RepID=UPI00366DF3C4